jgi:hypothetical protein
MDISLRSPAVRDVLAEERLMELGPGRPNELIRKKLGALSSQALFGPETVRRADCADACLAALWLYHDFLDESHAISQSISTVEGSLWHGIMHRREPDPSNAAYWFRRAGDHPTLETLAKDVPGLGPLPGSERWDPFHFIDLCERHRGDGSSEEMTLRRVQQREWELLFDWCFRRALALPKGT